jgi:hypothetical protein
MTVLDCWCQIWYSIDICPQRYSYLAVMAKEDQRAQLSLAVSWGAAELHTEGDKARHKQCFPWGQESIDKFSLGKWGRGVLMFQSIWLCLLTKVAYDHVFIK